MAFAFKGPASLTGASTISTTGNIATTGSGTLTVAGTTSCAALTSTGLVTAASLDLGDGGQVVTSISTTSGAGSAILANQAYVLANAGGLPTIVDVTTATSAIDLTAVTGNVVYMLASGGGAITQTSMTNIGSIANGTIIRFVVKAFTSAITIGVASGTPFKLVGSSVGSVAFGTVGQGLDFVAASGELYLLGGGYGV